MLIKVSRSILPFAKSEGFGTGFLLRPSILHPIGTIWAYCKRHFSCIRNAGLPSQSNGNHSESSSHQRDLLQNKLLSRADQAHPDPAGSNRVYQCSFITRVNSTVCVTGEKSCNRICIKSHCVQDPGPILVPHNRADINLAKSKLKDTNATMLTAYWLFRTGWARPQGLITEFVCGVSAIDQSIPWCLVFIGRGRKDRIVSFKNSMVKNEPGMRRSSTLQ